MILYYIILYYIILCYIISYYIIYIWTLDPIFLGVTAVLSTIYYFLDGPRTDSNGSSSYGCLWKWEYPGNIPKESGVSINRGTQNGWFIVENSSKIWMIWGYPHFRKPPITNIHLKNDQDSYSGWHGKEGPHVQTSSYEKNYDSLVYILRSSNMAVDAKNPYFLRRFSHSNLHSWGIFP